ncbi:helix-turn-helix domain-containing protein [Ruegeria marisrubri]|uniref:helix-turn-helix domain-containing protein n=1 Tax=Ruegeria marisrubri TaxID=1685379 RepID=UPI001CD6E882|nr:helix-turn-helix domain-containing protein [Ruegeria marisrubri]MCA0905151.1 helix-turn-helix domain-containing protein [Ruegeria marisrubri]
MTMYREQLEKYCGRKGYSKSGVGLSAGYNKNYVSDIISGKITPTAEALEALAEALNVPLAVLLFGDETDEVTREIVAKMRDIDEHGQRAVNAFLDSLASQKKT